VTGQRTFDHRLGSLGIAHLADHDDVRIGAQEAADGGGKSPAYPGIHLHLAQPWLRDLHRVFGGPDLLVRSTHMLEQRLPETVRLSR
jgi:hypothetical protein